MPPKSKNVAALDEIQAQVYAFLKPLGFRKKGRTFNREADEVGIFQVIHFQAGPYELAPPIPPYRLDLYGKFTVNLGVLIKELYEFEEWHKPTNFYQELFCQARTRLPILLYGEDRWWDLNDDTDLAAQTVISCTHERHSDPELTVLGRAGHDLCSTLLAEGRQR